MPSEAGEVGVIPYWQQGNLTIYNGDVRAVLAELPDESVQCCVVSPPYWSVRDYGVPGQVGLEVTPDDYVEMLVSIFRGVYRVLRRDGTLWLNLGEKVRDGELLGLPWRVALALKADCWWLLSEVVWNKLDAMPREGKRCPGMTHEQMFLLAKTTTPYYDHVAVRVEGDGEQHALRDVWSIATARCPSVHFAAFPPKLVEPCIRAGTSLKGCCAKCGALRARIVETDRKPTRPGRDNVSDDTGLANRDEQRHVTEYKTTGWRDTCDCNALSVPCTVLDPFMGSGTTLLVARQEGCKGIGIELNPAYVTLAKKRLAQEHFDFVGAAE